MKIKTIYYLSPRDMRKNRADSVHIMYSCAAFSNNGVKVTLITPRVYRSEYKVGYDKIFDLYDVPENFKIFELPTNIKEINNVTRSFNVVLNKFFANLRFALKSLKQLRDSELIIYSKCYISTVPYLLLKKVGMIKTIIVFETPFVKNNVFHKFIMKNVNYILGGDLDYNSKILFDNFGISYNKLLRGKPRYQTDYSSTHVDQNTRIKNYLSRKNKPSQILYGGKTGADSIRLINFCNIAKDLPLYNFIIVGANESAMIHLASMKIKNLNVFPFVPYTEYLELLSNADILVANYEDNYYNKHLLGPSKSGPYLSSNIPVIFSDLPSLRRHFSEELVYYANPENIDDWINKIQEVINNPEQAFAKATKAKEYVQNLTFTKAAKVILSEIESK